MKALTARRKAAPPTEADIRSFEQKAGLLLPQSLKTFLLAHNCIDALENVFVTDTGKVYYVDVFYPLAADYELSLQVVWQALAPYFEGEYVAFASDSGNWQYVIGLAEGVRGEVFFCRMDEAIPHSLTRLTTTLEAFIDRLERS